MATTCLFTSSAYAIEKLRLISDFNIVTGEKFKETEIGGLSGLYFDQAKNKLFAVSDDRGAVNDFRFYEFDLKIDDKSFSVSASNVVFLKDADGKPFKKDFLDCEGITPMGDDLIISSEGWINHAPVIMPELLIFSRDGKLKSKLDVPEKFLPAKDQVLEKGIRDNLAFEGLSATPDQSVVFVGTEEAINQDDRVSTPTHASTIRIIQYKDKKAVKEFAYTLEMPPSVKVAGLTVGDTGLSDLLAIDEHTFYSIERSFLQLAKRNVIRIYKNTITANTTDVSGIDALKKGHFTPVEKELLANLDDFTSSFAKDFQTLDNIEGITFGPKLSNGHQTLILVSDNNFNRKQRTLFLAFEIIP
jgi:3-phytase/alkaline phosphatase D